MACAAVGAATVTDIEEISGPLARRASPAGSGRLLRRPPPVRRASREPDDGASTEGSPSAAAHAATVPGAAVVCVRTWGCAHNRSDGEYMAGLLAAHGFRLTEQMEEAACVVLNGCTVKVGHGSGD